MTDTLSTSDFSPLLRQCRRRRLHGLLAAAVGALGLFAAFRYSGAFEGARYVDAAPTILRLVMDALPPDFSRWRAWGKPLLETLAMGVSGTVLASIMALPLAALTARNVCALPWLRSLLRVTQDMIRSIPGLIWGVIFVAAVGFGPLPGVLALAAHSTGMLAKLFSEAMEHVDPAPGAALRAHGVSRLGVLRFSVLPQVTPRLADLVLYRFEHNLRAAMTLGLVGAGGLGVEIVTAFHLFEYREASALILLLLAMVSTTGAIGAALRKRLLHAD